jgi:hypothetical protein
MRMARAGASGQGRWSLKKTISPCRRSAQASPRNGRSGLRPTWYSRRTPITSSGSAVWGERGEAAQVAEDDDDLPAVAFQERLVAGVDHQVCQLRGQEPPQPADPFQLIDLGAHALFEFAIPGSQLSRLTLDRVVVPLDTYQRLHPSQQFGLVERLVTKSSAPASMAWTFSWFPLAVIITTGRNAVDGFCRIRRHTSYPSRPGMKMSSSTRSGLCSSSRSRACWPEPAVSTLVAAGAQYRVEQPCILRQVVHDENRRRVGPAHQSESFPSRNARTCRGSARTLMGFSR